MGESERASKRKRERDRGKTRFMVNIKHQGAEASFPMRGVA